MKKKENINSEVEAARINAEGTIIASKINTKGAIIVAVIALITAISGTFLGSALEANKGQVNTGQEIQNQLNQAHKKIEELEEQLKKRENDNGGNPTSKPTTITIPTISAEEQLIKQNFDLIQKLKASYSSTDIVTIKDDIVEFKINEKAGYIYQDIMKTGAYDIIWGIQVDYANVIILDYETDEIICTYNTGKSNIVRHSPGNQKKFYSVVLRDDYDIDVSPPIQVVGRDTDIVYYGVFRIYLERKNSEYTPLTRFNVYIKDLDTGESYAATADDYIVFCPKNIITNEEGVDHLGRMSDSGMLSWGGNTYFSLNTRYTMDISFRSESDSELKSTHQMFDGSITNSNLIDIYLEFGSENDTKN